VRSLSIEGAYAQHRIHVKTLVPLIEAVAVEPTQIRNLKLNYCTLCGVDDEWNQLYQCIQTHLCGLEWFSFGEGMTVDAECQESFESIVQSCCAIPTLRDISVISESIAFSGATRCSLCQNLSEVRIPYFALTDEHLMAMPSSLLQSSSFKSLDIQISNQLKNPRACGRAMANVLRNKSNLYRFEINDLAEVTLQEEFLLEIIGAMKFSTSIRCLNIVCYDASSPLVQKALKSMLEENFTLESFRWRRFGTAILDRLIDFFLVLNEAGRSKVMGQHLNAVASHELWVEVMIQACDEIRFVDENKLSAIFYYLVHNPLLIGRIPGDMTIRSDQTHNQRKRSFREI
jgi:hypothetical protein